jgi:6-pyruvoyltetrahydropterin/6-carboxytetrahydropterin synthase
MGHRVPNHSSKCKNVHGHRYKAEITLEGDVVGNKGVSDEGMVIDFGHIKTIAQRWIDTYLDHGYMGQQGPDDKLLELLITMQSKIYNVNFVPTAENIAAHLFDMLSPLFSDVYGTNLRLQSIKLYETPNCFVVYQPH